MPKKIDPYSTHGQKIISLFARLMFSKDSHSLTDLSKWLRCSKQTILRLIDIIKRSYGVDIEETMEGNRKYYKIKKLKGAAPALSITQSEINALHMCRAFTEYLLGREFFEEASRALEKSQALFPDKKTLSFHHFASFRPGSIDYTPHQDAVRILIEAMDKKRICKISYKSIMAKRAKTFYVKPLKIFSYYDAIYVDARLAREPKKPYKEPQYDPLLAVHRIKKIELTERMFQFPKDYDFEKVFNKSFGVIKEGSFKVEVEFKGYSAEWVKERMWSPDQKITKMRGRKIKISFSASSKLEFIEWLFSFEDEAKLIKPDWLIEKVKDTISKMQRIYN
jgi:predicted DNA-binding transcriptional regulator YafY